MSGVQNHGFETDDQLNKKEGMVLTKRKVPDNPVDKNGETGIEMLPHSAAINDVTSSETSQELTRKQKYIKYATALILHLAVIVIFVIATVRYINESNNCDKNNFDDDDDDDDEPKKECFLTLCSGYGMLILVTATTYFFLVYFKIIKKYYGHTINQRVLKPIRRSIRSFFENKIAQIVAAIAVLAAIFGYIIYETHTNFARLQSLTGVFVLIAIGIIFSKHPRKIRWRPIICGSVCQFLLGVFCIRWEVGRQIFACFGDKVAEFLAYAVEGSSFVFSDFLVREKGVFAFFVLPTIFFFSLCISMLYYLEAMQWVLFKLGWILQSILGTTVCESVNAAANIFLGMAESPLLIKPYLTYLTESEIHSIMTSGFATVSGTVLAAYISFGAEPAHLITASVMAAPATLFYSKLFLPETEESKTSSNNITYEKSSDSSLLDAASNGANLAICLVLGIIANLVAFVSFVAFADGMLKWVTYLIGFEGFGIQEILGKIFIPLAWALGVEWDDCELVAQVIGTKTIVNEFVAFQKLGVIKEAGQISLRSAAIATYAICGFANPSSVGIMVGALSALAPSRRGLITGTVVRAFFAGCFVCFITASIAGLLMTDEMVNGTA